MERTLRWVLLVWSVLCLLPALAVAEPYGDPFRANTSTVGSQNLISVANGANGDSILLWNDGGRGNARFIQRYDAAGRQLQTEEWFVGFDAVDVALSNTGNYAVLTNAPDGSGSGVFVTVYNRAGSVVVPQFRVNDTTFGDQQAAAIAMNASGQFAVVWRSMPANGIYVKRFNANGTAVAPEALANTSNVGNFFRIDIAIDGQGNFVATWDHMPSPALGDMDVYARRYSTAGAPFAAPIRVNTYTARVQGNGRIAMSAGGAFVIVWTSYGQSGGNNWLVLGQRFDAAGSRLGGEFQVSAETSNYQEAVSVAMAANGSFNVAWIDDNRGIDASAVPVARARSYDGNGVARGLPFVVNTGGAVDPSVMESGIDADGNALLSWAQDSDIYARRYLPGGVVAQPISSGQLITGLAGAANSWQYFKITVPAGQNTLDVRIAGSVGDADLYVRWGALPSLTRWDGRPFLNGSNEGARMLNFPPGDWYIGVNGFSAYSGLSLQADSF